MGCPHILSAERRGGDDYHKNETKQKPKCNYESLLPESTKTVLIQPEEIMTNMNNQL